MTTKTYRVSTTIEEVPAQHQVTSLDNRGQIYEWLTRFVTRDTLHDKYGVSKLVSYTQALLDLTRLGYLTIETSRQKVSPAYSPSLRGFIRVTLNRTNLAFTSRNRGEVYENLKTSLYPRFAPSDRQFCAHLSGEICRRVTEAMPRVEIVNQLEMAGFIRIEELKHAPRR